MLGRPLALLEPADQLVLRLVRILFFKSSYEFQCVTHRFGHCSPHPSSPLRVREAAHAEWHPTAFRKKPDRTLIDSRASLTATPWDRCDGAAPSTADCDSTRHGIGVPGVGFGRPPFFHDVASGLDH